jgi:mannose-6-phosphate isomerase-like protein (cupin superfamily)
MAMAGVVNIEACFGKFADTFSPKIVGELNGQHVKLARLEGDKVPWHVHEAEDEMFFVLDGELEILERAGAVTLRPGEFYIVKSGVEHRVVPRGHVKLLLFEPVGIAHTGKVRAEITRDHCDRLDLS